MSAPANNFYGQNARWSTAGVSCTAFGTLSFIQGIDMERECSVVEYPNQLGNAGTVTTFNNKTNGTFTYLPSNTSTANGQLVTSTLQPTIGGAIIVSDSIDANNMINATNFKVLRVAQRRTVTGDEEVVVSVTAWDAIA